MIKRGDSGLPLNLEKLVPKIKHSEKQIYLAAFSRMILKKAVRHQSFRLQYQTVQDFWHKETVVQ